jgi:dipeptidyl aminopeptidase/acylaminoacyl peptidase
MHRAGTAAAFILALGLFVQPAARARQTPAGNDTPTIDQLISLKRAGSPAISPNGQWVAYTVRAANWDENNYHTEIYAKTSPMTYVKNAKTPTLIQHGATDRRVPPPNAYELYRGLQDVGVPSKLIIYKGFEGIGHGPSKPRSSRAVMQHNLEWFDKYIFGGSTTPTSRDVRR